MNGPNDWNAYADKRIALEPTGSGILDGMTFAVKDVFDIAGYTSGAGNPDWLRTHAAALRNAAVIDRLLAAGARLQGVTITDELMYSINGENAHYGTPVNPNAPGRIPGGSSSGSAVAAAAGLADFAIGTDTGGSVRVPASYCGVYGIRPTHGAIPADGLIPLAPSFDTVGWMARSADTLLKVGQVLLGDGRTDAAAAKQRNDHAGKADRGHNGSAKEGAAGHRGLRLLIAEDMWSLADEQAGMSLRACLSRLEPLVDIVEALTVAPQGLAAWADAFRSIQGVEIWREHGRWVTQTQPSFGPGIAERFAWARTLRSSEQQAAYALRESAVGRMEELLGDGDTLLVAPTVPSIAPPLGGTGEEVERRRARLPALLRRRAVRIAAGHHAAHRRSRHAGRAFLHRRPESRPAAAAMACGGGTWNASATAYCIGSQAAFQIPSRLRISRKPRTSSAFGPDIRISA